MEEGSREASEGLWGLKTLGQVEEVWLSQGRQGEAVIQTNNKHNGGFWEVWGRGSRAVWVIYFPVGLMFFRVPSL